jgi:hypothetical protein
MKFLILISLFFINSSLANHNLQINITPKDDLFDKMLTPLWNEIPYDYEISKKAYYKVLSDSVSVQINKTKINLGPKATPLFNMRIKAQNSFKLNWNLSKLNAKINAKLRFKFKKFGVSVTHDEYFIITASGINTSNTNLKLMFQNKEFKFSSISNQGFEFKNVDIEPEDGIGQVLRYIFDNVFSKNEVDRYITSAINKELKKWINDNKLINELQNSLNVALNKAQNSDIDLTELASNLRPNFSEFSFSPNIVKIQMKPTFNYKDLKVHNCATGMIQSHNKDSVQSSHSLIETMINNFATYEIWEDENLLEPLFCFGYKSYDSQGEPTGEVAESKFLGKKIRFNYWISPLTKPNYEYIPNQNILKISMNLKIKLISKKYPTINANNGFVSAKLVGTFKIEFNKNTGLNLVFQNFDLPSITGRVKVKWNRLTPSIRLPLNTVRSTIEKYINATGHEEMESINIIEPEFTFMNSLKLKIKNYVMKDSDHLIDFEIK